MEVTVTEYLAALQEKSCVSARRGDLRIYSHLGDAAVLEEAGRLLGKKDAMVLVGVKPEQFYSYRNGLANGTRRIPRDVRQRLEAAMKERFGPLDHNFDRARDLLEMIFRSDDERRRNGIVVNLEDIAGAVLSARAGPPEDSTAAVPTRRKGRKAPP